MNGAANDPARPSHITLTNLVVRPALNDLTVKVHQWNSAPERVVVILPPKFNNAYIRVKHENILVKSNTRPSENVRVGTATDPRLGKGLFATREFPMGSVVFEEDPFLHGRSQTMHVAREMAERLGPKRLADHLDDVAIQAIVNDATETQRELFFQFGSPLPSPEDATSSLTARIWRSNVYERNNDTKQVSDMYEFACRANHSCDPNVEWWTHERANGKWYIVFTALRDIAADEELFSNYVPATLEHLETTMASMGKKEAEIATARRAFLRDHMRFECRCAKCQ